MNQHIISRVAIYLLSVVMIFFGIYHIRHPRNMLAFVPENLPGGITLSLPGGADDLAGNDTVCDDRIWTSI